MKNSVKRVAVFALATLFVVTTLFTALVCMLDKSETPSAKSNVEINLPVNGETEKTEDVPEKEVIPETKVLLVDASGSMKNNIFASAGYDTVQKFADYIGQAGGNSHIYTNVVRTLDMGVKIVGVVSDLESYPATDVNSLAGKKYENVSLTFFLPEDVDATCVKDYQTNWSNALDQSNSTLVFVYADGSKLVVFDAYGKVEPEETAEAEKEEKENPNVVVKVDTEATTGDSISFKTLVLILGSIIDIFCIFGIILIALLAHNEKRGKEKDVPDDIEEAFKLPIGIDGSKSVSDEYMQMIGYAEKLNAPKLCRFAETVEWVTIDEAKNTPACGCTNGWTFMKQMADEGTLKFGIMSDFDFTDDSSVVDGVMFDHITMLISKKAKVNEKVKQKIISMCKSYKEVKF